MRFNFKKIASVLASAVMLTSTAGFAAAANYPAPFSSTGGVVVYGANAAKSDIIAAIKVQNSIKASGGSVSATASCTGECGPLFTGSSKIYINSSLNSVRAVLTETELPTVLAKSTFSGNVDATIISTIDIGSGGSSSTANRLVFQKQPTSSDDPNLGFALSTSTSNYIYNATATFSRPVNFTDSSSKNREIILFGEKFTVGSSTDSTSLVLYKSSTKLNFDSSGTTSEEVTIQGKKYTIELVSASTSGATIKVTDENGNSDQQTVTTGSSRKIQGISIAVITADSNNLKYTASLTAGADKLTLTSGSAVTIGDSGTNIDGTLVTFGGTPANLTKLVISVAAKNSEVDALRAGEEFIDPVFGSFKVSFAGGLNIPFSDSASRELITISSSGDDKLQVKLTDRVGNEATIQYVKTRTGASGAQLQVGDEGLNITVHEGAPIYKNEYVVVGNEDSGYLLKVNIVNSSSDYANDKVTFTNVFDSSEVFTSVQSAEGVGTVTIGGKVYNLKYYANDPTTQDTWNVSLDYPDSGSGSIILYPTFMTSKGAKVFFYEPLNVNLMSYTAGPNTGSLSQIKIPNGNGYTEISVTSNEPTNATLSVGGTPLGTVNTTDINSYVDVPVGQFKYRFAGSGTANVSIVKLLAPGDPEGYLNNSAFGLIEEKDHNSQYHGLIVKTKPGTSTSTDPTSVYDVYRTWSNDSMFNAVTWASNSNKASDVDLYGVIATKDSGDTNRPRLEISYPDEQVYANVYVAKSDAVITPGGAVGPATGGLIAIEDSVVSSYSSSNMIIVGGSCVNKVAAKILGSEDPICGADFTSKTNVGPTQYIIKTVKSPYNDQKIAVLVAGYEAADTVSAVDVLLQGASTDVDSSQVYPIRSTE
ncbi:MAG: hypothetical protein QXW97_01335 [Candidatus Pacearchaeota archaeon]